MVWDSTSDDWFKTAPSLCQARACLLAFASDHLPTATSCRSTFKATQASTSTPPPARPSENSEDVGRSAAAVPKSATAARLESSLAWVKVISGNVANQTIIGDLSLELPNIDCIVQWQCAYDGKTDASGQSAMSGPCLERDME